MENEHVECNFCKKKFSNKINLLQHQKTVKRCLKIQGKNEDDKDIECSNCKKKVGIRSYKQHKIKCDIYFENKDKEEKEEFLKLKISEKENKKIKKELKQNNEIIDNLKIEVKKAYEIIEKMKMELIEYKTSTNMLKDQNEKLQLSCENITMKLAEKSNMINTINNKTVVINNNQLTNDVLRQCAESFSIYNAYNINGITEHFTTSLEDHITCSDPSRSIFKYTNDKDEEIVDKDLDNLLPQYLSVIKDRNNFFYKEVMDYFKKNNVPLSEQSNYAVFYQALNNIIEKIGNKMSEKCKQHIIRECKRKFLEKNKNKNKKITKELTLDEVMTNIIENGGTINDFIKVYFGEDYDIEDETEEECKKRRDVEDIFIRKKREFRIKF